MLADKRYESILRMTDEQGFVRTKDLAQALGVSETTVRRDIDELDAQKRLVRVHGGVKSLAEQCLTNPKDEARMSDRSAIHAYEKELICRKAADLVHDGDSVFIDGGTTTVPLVRWLRDKKVRIITHNMLVAEAFDQGKAELFLLPGDYDPYYSMTVGPATGEAVEKFRFNIAFFSCLGVDPETHEVYTAEMKTPHVKRIAAIRSRQNVLLADSSKFDVKAYYTMAHTDNFDLVITDEGAHKLGDDKIPDNFVIVSAGK